MSRVASKIGQKSVKNREKSVKNPEKTVQKRGCKITDARRNRSAGGGELFFGRARGGPGNGVCRPVNRLFRLTPSVTCGATCYANWLRRLGRASSEAKASLETEVYRGSAFSKLNWLRPQAGTEPRGRDSWAESI